ncbi:MAG: HemK2/MTQ2 family protein methyltransferase [Candidatus Thorarchaeota archaeon]
MKLGKVKLNVSAGVYPPAEDTYLLLDSIDLKEDDSFLEVGCGAGIISLAAASIVDRVVSLDISLDAVRNTQVNLMTNHMDGHSSVIQSDLLSALKPGTKFSVIAFNPPYLPKEESTTTMDHALVGGKIGVELTERFIPQAVGHLGSSGRIYVVVSSIGSTERVVHAMENNGLNVSIVASEKMFFESIHILQGIALEGHTETVL